MFKKDNSFAETQLMNQLNEIYTKGSGDSFVVGYPLFEDQEAIVVETLDELGRFDTLLMLKKSRITKMVSVDDYLDEIIRRHQLLIKHHLADPFKLTKLTDQLMQKQKLEHFYELVEGQVVAVGQTGDDFYQYGYLSQIVAGQANFKPAPSVKFEFVVGTIALDQIDRLEAFAASFLLDRPALKQASYDLSNMPLVEVHLSDGESFACGQLLAEDAQFELYLTVDELGRSDSLLLVNKSQINKLINESDYLHDLLRLRKYVEDRQLADPFNGQTLIRQFAQDPTIAHFLEIAQQQVVSFSLIGQSEPSFGFFAKMDRTKLAFTQYHSGKYDPFAGQVELNKLGLLEVGGGELWLENSNL